MLHLRLAIKFPRTANLNLAGLRKGFSVSFSRGFLPNVKFVELTERFSRCQGQSGVFLAFMTLTMTANVRKTSAFERALIAHT